MDFNNNYNHPAQNVTPPGAPYTQPVSEGSAKLAGAAMILGIISIVTVAMMTLYLPFIFGSIAVVLAVLSRGKAARLLTQAKAGIICGIIGLAVNVLIFAGSLLYVFSNPDMLRETAQMYDDMCEQIYGVPSEELLGDSMEDIVDNMINGFSN